MVLEVGVTTTVGFGNPPGFQVYVVAPVAVNVEDEPLHNKVGLPAATTVGVLLTVTDTVRVFVQPRPFLPITV
jgi:hypothetical protein